MRKEQREKAGRSEARRGGEKLGKEGRAGGGRERGKRRVEKAATRETRRLEGARVDREREGGTGKWKTGWDRKRGKSVKGRQGEGREKVNCGAIQGEREGWNSRERNGCTWRRTRRIYRVEEWSGG